MNSTAVLWPICWANLLFRCQSQSASTPNGVQANLSSWTNCEVHPILPFSSFFSITFLQCGRRILEIFNIFLEFVDEMKGFARQWIEPELKFSMILFVLVLHASALVGIILGISLHSWISGIAAGGGAFFFLVTFLYIVYWGTRRSEITSIFFPFKLRNVLSTRFVFMSRYSWNWAHSFGLFLARRLDALKLILQVTFCTPPGQKWNLGGDSIRIQPIR